MRNFSPCSVSNSDWDCAFVSCTIGHCECLYFYYIVLSLNLFAYFRLLISRCSLTNNCASESVYLYMNYQKYYSPCVLHGYYCLQWFGVNNIFPCLSAWLNVWTSANFFILLTTGLKKSLLKYHLYCQCTVIRKYNVYWSVFPIDTINEKMCISPFSTNSHYVI